MLEEIFLELSSKYVWWSGRWLSHVTDRRPHDMGARTDGVLVLGLG